MSTKTNNYSLYLILLSFLILFPIISCEEDGYYEEIGSIFDRIITDDEYFKKKDFKNVIFFDEDSIEPGIKNYQPLLLYVYSSYCHYCQKYVPDFMEVMDYFEKNNLTMTFGRINGADNRRFSMNHNVRQYPTILLFYNKKQFVFKGNFNKKEILRFINKKFYGNFYKFEKIAEIDEIKEKNEINDQIFLLSTINEEKENKLFDEYSEENQQINYIKCFSEECVNKYGKDFVIIKNFDEKNNSYTKELNENISEINLDKLKKFMVKYGIESGALLEKDHFTLAKNNKKKMLIYYRNSEKKEQTNFDYLFKEVGIELRNKNIISLISDIEGKESFIESAEDFIIARHELPCILYKEVLDDSKTDNTKDYDEENEPKPDTYRLTNVNLKKINKEYILNFIKDIENKNIKKDLKSQFPPSPADIDPAAPFKIIVGRTYDKDVINCKDNVLVTFVDRKNRCELCKSYLNTVKMLGRKYRFNGNVVFTVIDGGNNEARDIQFKESDLPFIYLYTNAEKNKNIVKFVPKIKDSISDEEVEQFLKDNLNGKLSNDDL